MRRCLLLLALLGSMAVVLCGCDPPTVTNYAADPDVLWPPNNKMCDVALSYTVTDAVDPEPTAQVTSVECNEASFDPDNDVEIIDDHHVRLRATREGGNKDGRVYTIVLTATNSSGAWADYETTVVVPHDQRARP
jgi:hypothetical protein